MSSKRLETLEVKIGNIKLGAGNRIAPQTMTTTDTMDTDGTVDQSIECIKAGSELVRITAPSKKEAENLALIKADLEAQGYDTPLVADIHYTPNAAEVAAQYVEKVRVNPGNYVDKKKFEHKEYTDETYQKEIERIREKFVVLLEKSVAHDTAIRIGTNHGSLSDRIMSRYGDTPEGMVESAMEFLRIARSVDFHRIVLSMKSSNPIVMVKAYRTLVAQMLVEFGEVYPLHLGVTEAGDGEDGRVKSALGIGTLLEDGIGDTIRVSLTEDPQYEIPVCEAIIHKYEDATDGQPDYNKTTYLSPPIYKSKAVYNIGGENASVVCARANKINNVSDLIPYGYIYDAELDKWHSKDQAVDILITENIAELDSYPEGLIIASSELKSHLTTRQFQIIETENCTQQKGGTYLLELDLSEALEHLENKNFKHWLEEQRVVFLIDRKDSPLNSVRDFRDRLISNELDTPILWKSKTLSEGDRAIIDYTTAVGSPSFLTFFQTRLKYAF